MTALIARAVYEKVLPLLNSSSIENQQAPADVAQTSESSLLAMQSPPPFPKSQVKSQTANMATDSLPTRPPDTPPHVKKTSSLLQAHPAGLVFQKLVLGRDI
uniref:Uncharacterized protein n=1 Tax=Octactis speculum TaxID=3111310 RepID=A0A7S2G1S1_9STRA